MDEPTFDPRSWRKPTTSSQPQRPAPQPSGQTVPPTSGPNPDPQGIGTALPQAWDDVAKSAAASAATAAAPASGTAPAGPSDPSRFSWLPLGVAGGLLIAGGATAWSTRQPAPTPAQAAAATAAAPPAPSAIVRRIVLAGTGDIANALIANGVPHDEAAHVGAQAGQLLPGQGEVRAMFELVHSGSGADLNRLQASLPDGSGVVINRDSSGAFAGQHVAAQLSQQIKVLRGELDSTSFYSSALAAGLQDTLIPEFINAFSYDFNIASQISPGDTFEVAYRQATDAQGNPVGLPQLVYGSLTTREKSLALYRFQAPGGEIGWYDGNGASTKRGLMRTPVDGARITSGFGMRFHPVLKFNKMHKGTDFAAPIGTPIFAAKDGTVEWAAMKGPNGNLTILQHSDNMETYYLHQSMFMPGVEKGAHVSQGQKIGEIGTTGRSTGPHLHFEVHMQGQPVDPMGIPADDSKRQRLDGTALAAFIAQRNRVDVARADQAR